MEKEHRRHRQWVGSVLFTVLLLGLIATAIGGTEPVIAALAIVSVFALAAAFHFFLPGGEFFSIVFANSIGVYSCCFVFFVSERFPLSDMRARGIAFVMPLIAFLLGVLHRRQQIDEIVTTRHNHMELELQRASLWLLPLVAVGAGMFALDLPALPPELQNAILLISMAAIGAIGFLASKKIAVFLIDTGLLFEDFFKSASRLIKPAFAFLTCYSLLIIIFGSIYTILDRFSQTPNFVIAGQVRNLGFSEGLYLSVITLSTVGYGDILAISALARLVISIQLILGVILLLFGVEAVLSASRSR